jgi:hypothetical protein
MQQPSGASPRCQLGFGNDRAFVFNPASSDAATAAGMHALLTSGSPVARACLSSQIGTLAARNSCQGPWVSSANLSISFNPIKLRLPQRANLSFNVSNPLGAADLMLHGKPAQVMRLHRATEAGELKAGAISSAVHNAGRFHVGHGALLETGPLLQPILLGCCMCVEIRMKSLVGC